MDRPGAIGFFGKLPCAGDFVQRRLPSAFVDAWDSSFEKAVAESKTMLGPAWQEAYRASPVWRFLLAPRTCGESAWAGVMGPGADRVGRCFPMVIAAEVPVAPSAGVELLSRGGWFTAAARLLAEAQADARSVDGFDSDVLALPALGSAEESEAGDLLGHNDWSGATHWRLALPVASVYASRHLATLWSRLGPGKWCLWWTEGGGRVPASLLVSLGLPQGQAYAGFLDVAQGAGWRDLGPMPHPPSTVVTSAPVPFSRPAFVPQVETPELAPRPPVAIDSDVTQPKRPFAPTAESPRAAQIPDAFDLSDLLTPPPPDLNSLLRTSPASSPEVGLDDLLAPPRMAAAAASPLPPVAPTMPPELPASLADLLEQPRAISVPVPVPQPELRGPPADSAGERPAGREGAAARGSGAAAAGPVKAVLKREECGFTLVAAADGERDPRRRSSDAAIAQVVLTLAQDMRTADFTTGLQVLRNYLLNLHSKVRQAAGDLVSPLAEQCAVAAARHHAGQISVLRFGAASAWRWRRGHLQALFALDSLTPASDDPEAGDDLDDLLFAKPAPSAGGIGAPGTPAWDEGSCPVQAGDRVMLAATRRILLLPPDVLVRGLAMRTSKEAAIRIAASAGLSGDPVTWPFAVIEILS